MNRRIRLQKHVPQDRELWKKHYYQHQKHWQRRRLLALKAIWDGQSLTDVSVQQKIRLKTLQLWLDYYLHGGFDRLLSRASNTKKQLLSPQKQRIVRFMVLHKVPIDYGIDSYQWTADFMRQVIYQKWTIKISNARLYQLFNQWGLSLQKVHRDYEPADLQKQAEFIRELKKRPNN